MFYSLDEGAAMTTSYDAIVIGARCAGAPTAMLLAQAGHSVLLVDKATFPSDTLSTHVIHPTGGAALARWNLLERVQETGAPAFDRYAFDFGGLALAGSPRPADGIAAAICPRRTVLDALLLEAAAAAGAEVRQGFAVDELLVDDEAVVGVRGRSSDGRHVNEHARVVIGADGRHSLVARQMAAETYAERPARMAMYYAYWSGLGSDGFVTTMRADQHRGWASAPTNDGLTMLGFGWPIDEFHANRGDIERHFLAAIELAPEFAERVRGAKRESPFRGTAETAGWLRRPFGRGWALAGDAGYHKNPITALGISDAFQDAESLAAALDSFLTGERDFEGALADHQQQRDATVMPMYEMTDDFARLEPPPDELQALLAAIAGNQPAIDDFISVQAGTLSVPEFFDPSNLGRLMAAA
jgi:2-polyprenyl-6-methoxyphenol hydroxylase-like FAD-dependent oxidoreductase